MNLLVLLIVPLVTAIAILLPGKAAAKWIALAGSAAQLVASFLLLGSYRQAGALAPAGIAFSRKYAWFPSLDISFHLGVDCISVAMILLTAFVVLAGVLVSWNVSKMAKEYYFLLILLSLGAYGVFMSVNLFVLFFFLEIAVIPKYLLILLWGSGNKEYSANKLALMLMGGSALVLVGLLGIYFTGDHQTFDLITLAGQTITPARQLFFFPFLFIGFGIFTALFPFHTWVPDGHSSAPTAGSMFLAGISMKLGGFGCIRVATYLMPVAAAYYSGAIIILACVAILYGAFATMMQKDFKYINAYSSVSHCGFVLLGIGMLTQTALNGAVMQMVSHGLMTALFFAVIGMVYQRTHTRDVEQMGGLLKVMPFIITSLFIVGLCSLGLPGFSGFVAEMTVFMGSWEKPGLFYKIATLIACSSIVVTAVYILRAIGRVAMGPLREGFETIGDAAWNEKLAIVLLIAAILAIGLAPSWLQELVERGTAPVMQQFGKY